MRVGVRRGSPFSHRQVALVSGWPNCHVWMPPVMQVVFELSEHVIGCGHVSGLEDAALQMPRAGMEIRGAGPHHGFELKAHGS
jgi:hypothetical protein